MIKQEFNTGPFTIRPVGRMQVAGAPKQVFDIEYGNKTMHERCPATPGTQSQVIAQLDEALGQITSELRKEHECRYRIDLVDCHGETLGSFHSASSALPDMTAGLIDDRFPHWLRSADRLYSKVVTLNEYAVIRAQHELPALAWIADLLPEDVMTTDAEEWRAPTSWELRHVVGVGSFTGISGARAAELVGVTPANFRKYTASDSAKNRQSISFSMWHMLLHRLDIQRIPGSQA